MKAGPRGMIQLEGHSLSPPGVGSFPQGHSDLLHSEDPKHVESAKDIEGNEPLRHSRRCGW